MKTENRIKNERNEGGRNGKTKGEDRNQGKDEISEKKMLCLCARIIGQYLPEIVTLKE